MQDKKITEIYSFRISNGTPSSDKKPSPTTDAFPSSSRSPGDIEKHEDLKPVRGNLDAALKNALNLMAKEDW